ncbi:MAG: CRTAC1 family protein [Candidatus Eisenbacteria bacterium]
MSCLGLGELDNDGDLDCYVGNDGARQDRLYVNQGDGTFVADTSTPVTTPLQARRGACAGDYDNDGDVDLFVEGPATSRALYRNDDESNNGFLSVKLVGTTSNPSAIGAKVHVLATIGGNAVWQRRDISGQDSFNGHNDQRAHFGLGDATGVDSLYVEWPSGMATSLGPLLPNQFLTVTEGATSGVERDARCQAQPGHAANRPAIQQIVGSSPRWDP